MKIIMLLVQCIFLQTQSLSMIFVVFLNKHRGKVTNYFTKRKPYNVYLKIYAIQNLNYCWMRESLKNLSVLVAKVPRTIFAIARTAIWTNHHYNASLLIWINPIKAPIWNTEKDLEYAEPQRRSLPQSFRKGRGKHDKPVVSG